MLTVCYYAQGVFITRRLNVLSTLIDADITVDLTNHHYHFGTAIVSDIIMGDSADSDAYRDRLLSDFNQAGPENDLKWAPRIGE